MIDGMFPNIETSHSAKEEFGALTLIDSAFGGPDSLKGNTGPFWVGSGE